MSFVHLHTHSEYSLLDGANRLTDLVHQAKEYEMPGLALTDHGCLFGAWTFHKLAKKEGIKPIIGMEAYVAPGDRRDRTRSNRIERPYYHLVLLARDIEGYRNLMKLSSIGYTEGFYHRPRIDREVLAAHSEGLIVSSACMAGEVANNIMADNWEGAKESADWYANLFQDRYYLEVQAHDSEGQADLNTKIFKLSEEMGLPVVATNDAHFLEMEDHEAHDVLLCIGLGRDRSDPDRMRYDQGLYFKSAGEIAEHFPDRPDVLDNTLKIAEEVNLGFKKSYHLPAFPLPKDHTDENGFLVHIATEGAKKRYGEPLPEAVQERLDYELGVITETGYAGYFLITWDFIDWARQNGIPVGPGRGSAAGSIVAYVLWITNLDPLEFGLLFERFLNPERISMPDIDIDFCYQRRAEVIGYVKEKYGQDAVGQIITFGTMKSRAVIRDVGRTLGFEPFETDKIAKMIPNAPGQTFTVEKAVKKLKDVKKLYDRGGRHKKLFDYSMTLEGLSRHSSVHAAGVVIAPGPLDDYVPVCIQTGKNDPNGDSNDVMHVTQYDMNCLEDVGMLKMDFLGLKTLTVIHDTVESVKNRSGELRNPESGEIYESMDQVPRDDPAVYKMLAGGGTAGVFQFESRLAIDKLRAMRCDRFDDLVATNALIRPGPLDSGMTDRYIRRKLGEEQVSYDHPDLQPVLESTYGIIVYQEQVMRIANILAGYNLAEADVLRKAMGKKISKLIKKELTQFVTKSVGRGVDKSIAESLAEQIETFGRYGFNLSHSVAYSLLSYHTAWLKVHFPAEFMAAMLSAVLSNTDDVVKYIGECRDLPRYIPRLNDGIEVLPPDVNESGWKFTAVGATQIRFGLGAVRGVGLSAAQSILIARKDGHFGTMFDFLERIDLRALNKRSVEALIAAGALDSFGHRSQLLEGLETAYSEISARRSEAAAGQGSLFDISGVSIDRIDPGLPETPEWPEQERLKREKEALGFFISGHPLEQHRDLVMAFNRLNSGNLKDYIGQPVHLACVVTKVDRQISRRDSSEWGKITVEDFHGTTTVLAFKESWLKYRGTLLQDASVLIVGKVSGRERDEEDPPVFLEEAIVLEDVANSDKLILEIEVFGGTSLDASVFADAKKLLMSNPGMVPVELTVGSNNGAPEPLLRSRTLRVNPNMETLGELRGMFGNAHVRLVTPGNINRRASYPKSNQLP